MLGRFPSRTVIIACLLIAFGSLFLRNIVYIAYSGNPGHLSGQQAAGNRDPIILAYHERPPYYVTTGNNVLSGLVGEIGYSAFQRSGLSFTLQVLPPNRQLVAVKSDQERLCALGWFKTPEREKFATFTLPLYQDLPTAVIARADITISPPVPTIAELFHNRNLTLLVKDGYSYGRYVDDALQRYNPVSTDTTADMRQMLEMIDTGKADYFITSSEEASEIIATSSRPDHYHIIRPRDVPPGNLRYYMCSKQVTPEEIRLLNTAISTENRTMGRTFPNQ